MKRGLMYWMVAGVLALTVLLAAAASVWVLIHAPEQWTGAVVVSHAVVAVAAATAARRGPEAAMRGLLGKIAKWELADTRADLDVVGPITGETQVYDWANEVDDEDSIPGPVDDESQAVAT